MPRTLIFMHDVMDAGARIAIRVCLHTAQYLSTRTN